MTPSPAAPAAAWRVVEPSPADSWPWAVQALADIHREVELDIWGNDDLWMPSWVWQPILAGSPDSGRRLYLALADRPGPTPETAPPGEPRAAAPDDVLGVAHVQLPLRGSTHLAHVDVMVRPSARRAGVGTGLLGRVEADLAASGRDVVVSSIGTTPEPPAGPGALLPATGSGRVAADAPSARFATRHGYTLEQVERHSVLVVPDDLSGVVGLRDEALAHAGADYRVHVWHDDVPSTWREAFAGLMERMVTDAPTGALAYGADPWDASRVGRWLEALVRRHQQVTISAAEHVPTGVLAGHSVLMYPEADVPFAFQEATLVRADHRGRRLGLAVKTTNLLAVRERRPGLRRIHTDNAEENAPMLAINVALGFTADGGFAAWQKRL